MSTLQAVTRRLVAEGAVLETASSATQPFLVGELHWITPHDLFWFTAHGDGLQDGQVLHFDDAQVRPNGGVEFRRDGACVGRLTTIAQAAVDDPDDYRVAFSLWQETQPRTRSLISAALQSHLARYIAPTAAPSVAVIATAP